MVVVVAVMHRSQLAAIAITMVIKLNQLVFKHMERVRAAAIDQNALGLVKSSAAAATTGQWRHPGSSSTTMAPGLLDLAAAATAARV